MIVRVGLTEPIEGEESRVGGVEVVELMRLAVRVEHGRPWIRSEFQRSGLVGRAADRDVLAEIEFALEKHRSGAAFLHDLLELLPEPVMGRHVGLVQVPGSCDRHRRRCGCPDAAGPRSRARSRGHGWRSDRRACGGANSRASSALLHRAPVRRGSWRTFGSSRADSPNRRT